MAQKKPLQLREKELQTLLAKPEGRKELHELEALYYAASGKVRPEGASLITYILVHERQSGLIGN